MKQYALLFACLFFLCVGSKAQEQPTRWTLRACLDYALDPGSRPAPRDNLSRSTKKRLDDTKPHRRMKLHIHLCTA